MYYPPLANVVVIALAAVAVVVATRRQSIKVTTMIAQADHPHWKMPFNFREMARPSRLSVLASPLVVHAVVLPRQSVIIIAVVVSKKV